MSGLNNDPFNKSFFQDAEKRFQERGGFNNSFFQNAQQKFDAAGGFNSPFFINRAQQPAQTQTYLPPVQPQPIEKIPVALAPSPVPKAPAPKVPSFMGELSQTLSNKKSPPAKVAPEPKTEPKKPPQDPPKPPNARVPRALPVPLAKAPDDAFETEFNEFYLNIENCLPSIVDVISYAMTDRSMRLDKEVYELAQLNKTLLLIKKNKDMNELKKLKERFKDYLSNKSKTKAISSSAKHNIMYSLLGYMASSDTSLLETIKLRLSEKDEPRYCKQRRIASEEEMSTPESSYKLFFHEFVKSILKNENISEGDQNYEAEFETVYYALNKSSYFKELASAIEMGLNNRNPQQMPYAIFNNNESNNTNRAYNQS